MGSPSKERMLEKIREQNNLLRQQNEQLGELEAQRVAAEQLAQSKEDDNAALMQQLQLLQVQLQQNVQGPAQLPDPTVVGGVNQVVFQQGPPPNPALPQGAAAPIAPPAINQNQPALPQGPPANRGLNLLALRTAVTMDMNTIPVFTGETSDVSVEHFIKNFKSFVKINDVKSHLFGNILDLRTEGLANDVVNNMTDAQKSDIKEIEKALKREFRGCEYEVSLDQKVANTKQMPGETVMTFYSRLSKAVRDLKAVTKRHQGITDEAWKNEWENKIFRQFVGGLRHELYTFVMARKPTNLMEAREAAITAEETQNRGRGARQDMARALSAGEEEFGSLRISDAELINRMEQLFDERQRIEVLHAAASGGDYHASGSSTTTWRSRPPTPHRGSGSSSAPGSRSTSPQNSPGRQRRNNNVCHMCNEYGHWAKYCPHVMCGHCSGRDHIPSACPKITQPKN